MISTSKSYDLFQRRLDRIYKKGSINVKGFLGYEPTAIISRIKQRYAALTLFKFTKYSADMYRRIGRFPSDEEEIILDGISIDANSTIKIFPKRFIIFIFEFLAHWFVNLFTIVLAFRLRRKYNPVTLLFGVGAESLIVNGSDKRFLVFCELGPITPLANTHHLLIQSRTHITSSQPEKVKFGPHPLLMALLISGLGARGWLFALRLHVQVAVSWARAVRMSSCLVLLGRDVAYHAAAYALNQQGSIKDIFMTNSNSSSQPLWFWALPNRRYKTHLVWYSQNSYPITYSGDLKAYTFPQFYYIRADFQWVWTEGFRDYLAGICPRCSYKVVGSIVWHLISGEPRVRGNLKSIYVFDVTPINELAEQDFGLIRNFYSEDNVIAFIDDIVTVVKALSIESGVQTEIVLKHKRSHQSIHSLKYLRKIDNLVDLGLIKLIEPSANLYDLILSSDLVIAIPYSSPVYIGSELGKKAFWYDPTSTLEWKHKNLELPLIKGKNNLLSEVRNVLV